MFFFKTHAENEARRLVSDLFCFLKKLLRSKKVVSSLVLIYFGRPPGGLTIKTNCIAFLTVDPEICSSLKKVWN